MPNTKKDNVKNNYAQKNEEVDDAITKLKDFMKNHNDNQQSTKLEDAFIGVLSSLTSTHRVLREISNLGYLVGAELVKSHDPMNTRCVEGQISGYLISADDEIRRYRKERRKLENVIKEYVSLGKIANSSSAP